MMFIRKFATLLISFFLPVLIWQSYWCNNFYATNLLQFSVISLFLMSVAASILIFHTPEDKKLELNVNRRKNRFNNKVLDFVFKFVDVGCIAVFVSFGYFNYAFMLIVSMVCIQVYVDELEKV